MAAIFQTTISHAFSWIPNDLINNIPSLVQIMAWNQPGDKPLSEPIMVNYWHINVSLSLNELSYIGLGNGFLLHDTNSSPKPEWKPLKWLFSFLAPLSFWVKNPGNQIFHLGNLKYFQDQNLDNIWLLAIVKTCIVFANHDTWKDQSPCVRCAVVPCNLCPIYVRVPLTRMCVIWISLMLL